MVGRNVPNIILVESGCATEALTAARVHTRFVFDWERITILRLDLNVASIHRWNLEPATSHRPAGHLKMKSEGVL